MKFIYFLTFPVIILFLFSFEKGKPVFKQYVKNKKQLSLNYHFTQELCSSQIDFDTLDCVSTMFNIVRAGINNKEYIYIFKLQKMNEVNFIRDSIYYDELIKYYKCNSATINPLLFFYKSENNLNLSVLLKTKGYVSSKITIECKSFKDYYVDLVAIHGKLKADSLIANKVSVINLRKTNDIFDKFRLN